MLRFFEEQQLRDVIGLGHSLGAISTFYTALAKPELFSKLILIEPIFLPPQILDLLTTNGSNPHVDKMVNTALNRRNRWASRQEAWERFRKRDHFIRLSDDALWDYVNGITVDDGDEVALCYPREWEAHFYAMPPFDVWELLPQLTQPLLTIRGTESDTMFPPAWAHWQRLQPNTTFIELPNLGHLLMLENPSLVAKTILDWLA